MSALVEILNTIAWKLLDLWAAVIPKLKDQYGSNNPKLIDAPNEETEVFDEEDSVPSFEQFVANHPNIEIESTSFMEDYLLLDEDEISYSSDGTVKDDSPAVSSIIWDRALTAPERYLTLLGTYSNAMPYYEIVFILLASILIYWISQVLIVLTSKLLKPFTKSLLVFNNKTNDTHPEFPDLQADISHNARDEDYKTKIFNHDSDFELYDDTEYHSLIYSEHIQAHKSSLESNSDAGSDSLALLETEDIDLIESDCSSLNHTILSDELSSGTVTLENQISKTPELRDEAMDQEETSCMRNVNMVLKAQDAAVEDGNVKIVVNESSAFKNIEKKEHQVTDSSDFSHFGALNEAEPFSNIVTHDNFLNTDSVFLIANTDEIDETSTDLGPEQENISAYNEQSDIFSFDSCSRGSIHQMITEDSDKENEDLEAYLLKNNPSNTQNNKISLESEDFLKKNDIPRKQSILKSVFDISDISPSSKIPIISNEQSPKYRKVDFSPRPKSKAKERITIANDVLQYLLDKDEPDGDKFLKDRFGDDPQVLVDEKALNEMQENDIALLFEAFKLPDTSESWKDKHDKLDIIIQHLRSGCPEKYNGFFKEKVYDHLEEILELVLTKRSKLLEKVILFIRELVCYSESYVLTEEFFVTLIHLLIPMTRSSQTQKFILNLSSKSLCLMIEALNIDNFKKIFSLAFNDILKQKKLKGEKYSCLFMIKYYICRNHRKLEVDDGIVIISKLLPFMKDLAIDGNSKTRSEVVEIYLVLIHIFLGSRSDIEERLFDLYSLLPTYLKSRVTNPIN